MKNLMKASAVAAIALAPMPAMAVTGNVEFGGTVTHTCAITVNDTAVNVLALDTSRTNLSSTNTGGDSGSVTVVAGGSDFNFSVDAPSFSSGDVSNTTSVSSYVLSGATSGSGTDSSAVVDLEDGSTNAVIDMSATKTAGVFENGNYAATVVVRCE